MMSFPEKVCRQFYARFICCNKSKGFRDFAGVAKGREYARV